MPSIFNFIILVYCVTTIQTSIYENNAKQFVIKRAHDGPYPVNYEDHHDMIKNNKKQRLNQNILPKANEYLQNKKTDKVQSDTEDGRFIMDPVLNAIKRRRKSIKTRRKKDSESSSESSSSSSSLELQNWKDEWRQQWKIKKFNAYNHSIIKGDTVNMVAARPWGTPCGDPNQHDMPWGSCMLPMECEAEYRVYRGDIYCGRTQFVCCSLRLTTYDMYQGEDLSFEDSDLETDSEERKHKKDSKENNKNENKKKHNKRKKERERRKKKIRKYIKKIIKEIRKILNRSYRNGTKLKKKKTKQLKKFIKDLKKRYKKERQAVKDVHELELIKIDNNLMKKLNEIRVMNKNFVNNATFKEIIVNGTTNVQGARMLVEAYPELGHYFQDITRRNNEGGPKDYLDYDIEYGMLYY